MGIFAVITNPNAKRNRKEPDRLRKLKAIMGDDGMVLETAVPDDIQKTADDLVSRHQIDVLGICGGDGTMQHTLTAFIHAYGGTFPPLFLPLRGGTMNTMSHSVGLRGSPEANLAFFLDKYLKGEGFQKTKRNLMKIATPDRTLFCYLFGNGIVANYLDLYYSSPYDGPKSAIWSIGMAVLSAVTKNKYYDRIWNRMRQKVVIDGFEVPREDLLGVLAATIRDVGVGFKPLYRAGDDLETFHVLACGLTHFGFIGNLPRFFLGKRLKGRDHFDFLAKELSIQTDAPFKFVSDGELNTASRLRVTAGPITEIPIW